MAFFGEHLVQAGLITQEQLAKALRVQQHEGGRLGPIISNLGYAAAEKLDRLWIETYVEPALQSAIDRNCENRFSISNSQIVYEEVHQRTMIFSDMLNSGSVCGTELTITGTAIVKIGERDSLPFRFTIEPDSGFALLEESAEVMIRRWFDLLDRQGVLPAPTPRKSAQDITAA